MWFGTTQQEYLCGMLLDNNVITKQQIVNKSLNCWKYMTCILKIKYSMSVQRT